MIQPNLHDWYVGQILQGLLSHPNNITVGEEVAILSEDEKREVIFSEVVEIAFGIADAVMEIRKMRAGAN